MELEPRSHVAPSQVFAKGFLGPAPPAQPISDSKRPCQLPTLGHLLPSQELGWASGRPAQLTASCLPRSPSAAFCLLDSDVQGSPCHHSICCLHLQGSTVLSYKNGIPTSLARTGEQWDLPNAWPPLQHMVIAGEGRGVLCSDPAVCMAGSHTGKFPGFGINPPSCFRTWLFFPFLAPFPSCAPALGIALSPLSPCPPLRYCFV